MQTRPTVFLSHSSEDKAIIEKIWKDLMSCRMNAWYAEWEIPPGSSFRRKIFEEAIPNSDCFFVYLSEASIKSYWVQKELDAAFIEESRDRNLEIVTFAQNDGIRKRLSPDLAALHSPVLSEENYDLGLRSLLVAIFEAKIRRVMKEKSLQQENIILEQKVEISDLQKQIAELRMAQLEKIPAGNESTKDKAQDWKGRLRKAKFEVSGKRVSALEIFSIISHRLHTGMALHNIQEKLNEDLIPGYHPGHQEALDSDTVGKMLMPLLAAGLIEFAVRHERIPLYYLTAEGLKFAASL